MMEHQLADDASAVESALRRKDDREEGDLLKDHETHVGATETPGERP
jgi:hypothetical protein